MTSKAQAMGLVPIAISLYMFYLAFRYNHQFAMSDSNRWMFILVPFFGGVVVTTLTFMGIKRESSRRVLVTPGFLLYKDAKAENNFQVAWKSLAYSLPTKQKQMVRTLQIATVEKTVYIHDLFMPNFDKLAAEIRNRKTRAIGSGSNTTSSIDSGKVGSIDPALLGRHH